MLAVVQRREEEGPEAPILAQLGVGAVPLAEEGRKVGERWKRKGTAESGRGYAEPSNGKLDVSSIPTLPLHGNDSLPSIVSPEYSRRIRSASTSFPTVTIANPVNLLSWV